MFFSADSFLIERNPEGTLAITLAVGFAIESFTNRFYLLIQHGYFVGFEAFAEMSGQLTSLEFMARTHDDEQPQHRSYDRMIGRHAETFGDIAHREGRFFHLFGRDLQSARVDYVVATAHEVEPSLSVYAAQIGRE